MRLPSPARILGVALRGALLGLALLLTSCAGDDAGIAVVDSETGASAPDFSGPWAEEFKFRWALAPDDEIRNMLRDERIGDAEKQAVTERFKTCMSSNGVQFKDFEEGGAYTFSFDANVGAEKANQIADDCSASAGVDAVIYLYYVTRQNPQNLDQSAEIVACLHSSGLVSPQYSVEIYKAGESVESYALGDRQAAISELQRCEANPNG